MSLESFPQKPKEELPKSLTDDNAVKSQLEFREKTLEDFAGTISKTFNSLNNVQILDANSFYELGVGLQGLKTQIESGRTELDDLNHSFQLLDNGIQKIANIQGKMFTRQDLEWTISSISALNEVSEMAMNLHDEAKNEQSAKLLFSISESAKRKTIGLNTLADAMNRYLSETF